MFKIAELSKYIFTNMNTRVSGKNIKELMFKFFKKEDLNNNDFLNELAKAICAALKKEKSLKCITKVIEEYECEDDDSEDSDDDSDDSEDESDDDDSDDSEDESDDDESDDSEDESDDSDDDS
jgi:hypothetical protein